MHYYIVSIFPEIFQSFLATSLIHKAQEKGIISFTIVNPRDFCNDSHRQIDDTPYGGGPGMIIKGQPIIDSIKRIMKEKIHASEKQKTKILLLHPSKNVFCQRRSHNIVDTCNHLVLICGRYEGIDHRVSLWCQKTFHSNFHIISIGKFVTMGGEVPAMIIIESTARLIPGVIQQRESRQHESYRPEQGGNNIEHPQYTRPQQLEGFTIPSVLTSGNHQKIQERKQDNTR